MNPHTNYSDIEELVANANSESSFEEKRYFFDGDLHQLSQVQKVATVLGVKLDIEGGIPFAKSEKDFTTIKQYIIAYKREGWWNYVTKEEFCRINGEFYFDGKYANYRKEILQAADELGICIQTGKSVLFATSEEDYKKIINKLNIAN